MMATKARRFGVRGRAAKWVLTYDKVVGCRPVVIVIAG
jgi:hypothetical protein